MERKQSAARAAALALAERAARMAQREQRIAQELAGFLGARERVSAILEVAQRRCETIAARAHKQAHASQAQAEAHVVELVALIGDRQESPSTGLSRIRRACARRRRTRRRGHRVEDVGADARLPWRRRWRPVRQARQETEQERPPLIRPGESDADEDERRQSTPQPTREQRRPERIRIQVNGSQAGDGSGGLQSGLSCPRRAAHTWTGETRPRGTGTAGMGGHLDAGATGCGVRF